MKPPPYAGQCLCGAIEYRIDEAPLTLYACHCTDCQKRSGSAFGLSLWVRSGALEVTKGEPQVRSTVTADGKPQNFRMCGACTTRLWTERPERGVTIVRAGTLRDTSWTRPVAHIWTRSAQRWFAFPEGVARFEKQADPGELMALWRKARQDLSAS